MFVAIDFKGGTNFQKVFRDSRNIQLGITVLDTHDLKTQLQLPQEKNKEEHRRFISTQNFATGKPYKCVNALKTFGINETISIYDAASKIRQCMKPQDDVNRGESCKVVIVYHGFQEDWRLITSLRISTKNHLGSILTALETANFSIEVSNHPKGKPLSLESLAEELRVPFSHQDYHVAGNDTNCTLRALLLLAVRHYENTHENIEGPEPRLISLLGKIGQAPLPARLTPEEVDRLITL